MNFTDPNDVVRTSIWTYPNLFGNRADVLHHIFYVLGNGWEWKNGTPFMDDIRHYNRADDEAYFRSTPLLDEFVENPGATWNATVDRVRTNIDTLMHDMTFDRVPYPPCDHTLAATVPDDITSAWQAEYEAIAAIVEPLHADKVWMGSNNS